MIIKAENAGKRFNRDWIFRKLTCTFSNGNAYAITGPNGSGKSTLLQSIAANMNVNEGKIEWFYENKIIDAETVFSQVCLCAPYLEVIEEMTASEFLHFHKSFKPILSTISITQILEIVG